MKSFFYLLEKLSVLGQETLDQFNLGGNNGSFADNIGKLCEALLQLSGEASSVAIAEEIIRQYQNADEDEKQQFFEYLHEQLGTDESQVADAIAHYQEQKDQASLLALGSACDSPRLELLRTLNTASGGTQALITMREDVQKLPVDHPARTVLDLELLRLFCSWFNRGFLELQTIDWRTPAWILEKLIQYESVHEIQGWPDLRRRLQADRGCYGFFHPAIPGEPLIFVEAALTHDISDNIQDLLEQEPPGMTGKLPDTAVFYSINNCLNGLRGVSFGNFLIKQVIEHLAHEMPHITRYATLSPVPGFRRWVEQAMDGGQLGLDQKQQALIAALRSGETAMETLQDSAELAKLMTTLCAHYLLAVKSRGNPADPVARFHLGNGASLDRINWWADPSDNGMQQSFELMVNYLYDRKAMGANHEAYQSRQALAYSSVVKKLLGQAPAGKPD
jgi:malonyl-CoA decarboxylase